MGSDLYMEERRGMRAEERELLKKTIHQFERLLIASRSFLESGGESRKKTLDRVQREALAVLQKYKGA